MACVVESSFPLMKSVKIVGLPCFCLERIMRNRPHSLYYRSSSTRIVVFCWRIRFVSQNIERKNCLRNFESVNESLLKFVCFRESVPFSDFHKEFLPNIDFLKESSQKFGFPSGILTKPWVTWGSLTNPCFPEGIFTNLWFPRGIFTHVWFL